MFFKKIWGDSCPPCYYSRTATVLDLYCTTSSATLAFTDAELTDLGALPALCDGTLGQCEMGSNNEQEP